MQGWGHRVTLEERASRPIDPDTTHGQYSSWCLLELPCLLRAGLLSVTTVSFRGCTGRIANGSAQLKYPVLVLSLKTFI